jgi:hypothetical protein
MLSKKKFSHEYLMTLLLLLVTVSCSSEGDPELPGECQLVCGSAKISANDNVRFRILSSPADLTCVGVASGTTADAAGPITIEMIVEKPRVLKYKSPFGTDESPETETANWQSVGGVIFEPVITGLMAAGKTSPENATIEGAVVTPFKYAGIVTPKSEWCTDSCGVARVEIWPTCVGGSSSPVGVQFHSGGLYSKTIDYTMNSE